MNFFMRVTFCFTSLLLSIYPLKASLSPMQKCANPFSCQTQLSWFNLRLFWGWSWVLIVTIFYNQPHKIVSKTLFCQKLWSQFQNFRSQIRKKFDTPQTNWKTSSQIGNFVDQRIHFQGQYLTIFFWHTYFFTKISFRRNIFLTKIFFDPLFPQRSLLQKMFSAPNFYLPKFCWP